MKPYFETELGKLYHGDCLEIMPELEPNSADLLLTDPPYGYSFMGKDWDKAVPKVEVWKECLRVLKPGAFCLVMSAPRQDVLSRMMMNLETAGFRTDFTSIYWTYASGFPKAGNIGKIVDKRLGAKRKIIKNEDTRSRYDNCKRQSSGHGNNTNIDFGSQKGLVNITTPATDQAKALDGSYAGFQPKPAVEVIIVCMKPLDENTFVDQAMKNRKGITWLDDCRIPYNKYDIEEYIPDRVGYKDGINHQPIYNNKSTFGGKQTPDKKIGGFQPQGRFPANLLVSDDVLNDGKVRESQRIEKPCNTPNLKTEWGGTIQTNRGARGYSDSGSFSRYFDLDAWDRGARDTFPFMIVPKASKGEKNKGCEDLPLQEAHYGKNMSSSDKGTISGSKLPSRNFHPTVKPLKLFRYLITLASRPGDMVLDPYVGSGTTAVACEQLSRKWIIIDDIKDYCEISVKRIESEIAQMKLF